MQGQAESLSKMHKAAGVRNQFEAEARKKVTEVALENLGINSLDSKYLRVGDAANDIGLDNWYGPCNTFVSKLAHPTAGIIIGIMHQHEMIRELQCYCTTVGVYFAEQCAIALSEAISAFPSK
jgi:hypothetical protein